MQKQSDKKPGGRQRAKKSLIGLCFTAITLLALYFTGPLRWLGYPTIAILSSPTRVEIFKLDGLNRQPTRTSDTLADYPILARGRPISNESAVRLSRSLLSPSDYVFGDFDLTACHISPGAGFRFWKNKEFVDVAVCFWCSHILVLTHDENGNVIHRYLAPYRVEGLNGFVRRAFPNDLQMQGALSMYEMHEK